MTQNEEVRKPFDGDRWEEIEDRCLKPASDAEKAEHYERDVTDLMAAITAAHRDSYRDSQEIVRLRRRAEQLEAENATLQASLANSLPIVDMGRRPVRVAQDDEF